MSAWRRVWWIMGELPVLMYAWEAAKPELEKITAATPTDTIPQLTYLYGRLDRLWKVLRKGIKPQNL
jgi:hypothetical protein